MPSSPSRRTLVSAGWICVLAGCSGDSTAPVPPTPVRFSLQWMQGLDAPADQVSLLARQLLLPSFSAPAVTLSLGPIRNTTDFYFILANGGGQPITSVTLATSNAAFQVSPATIDLLSPASTTSLLPIIRVTAVHGTAASGIGDAPLLSPGDHSADLQIDGQTTDASDVALPVELTTTLDLSALVMDVEVFSAGGEVNLAAPSSAGTGQVLDHGARIYDIPEGDWRIKNTGNVPIVVLDAPQRTAPENPRTLGIGASITFPTPVSPIPCVGLDGGGTVRDPARLPTESDGRTYMCFAPAN